MIINRIKTWWKTSTPMEKVNTVLNIVGIGTGIYCIRKMDHVWHNMDITLHLRKPEEIEAEADHLRIENNTSGMECDLVRTNPPVEPAEEPEQTEEAPAEEDAE